MQVGGGGEGKGGGYQIGTRERGTDQEFLWDSDWYQKCHLNPGKIQLFFLQPGHTVGVGGV